MSKFKKKLTAFTAMLAFLSVSGAATFAAPGGDVIGNTNNVGFVNNGNRLDVNINGGHGAVGQVDWKNFSVGKGEQVNFGFSGLSQTVINRVLGGQASAIYGKLTNSCVGGGACQSYANTSKVILINPAGIMFGAGSQIDLNSFTASTHDIKGIKNIKGVVDAAQLDYLRDGTVNYKDANGKDTSYNFNSNLTFDSNYTEAFKEAGTKYDAGKTFITADGATFAKFDGDKIADYNNNKSLAMISDNITYKDSLIKTGDNLNYGSGTQSMSNVRLITGDGVSFEYLANGYLDNYNKSENTDIYGVAKDTKTDVVRNISMDNTKIESGEVHIQNISNADGSNIKIANSVIKGTKLVNKENGDIMIVGSKDINIDNSRLETVNTYPIDANGNVLGSTTNQNGGEIAIFAGKNVKVKDSLLSSAGSKDGKANAGKVRIYAYDGKAALDNTKVLASADAEIVATENVTLNNSLIQASNKDLNKDSKNNVKIAAAGGVNLKNSVIDASGDINIKSAYSDGTLSGNIIIEGDLDADGGNKSLLNAGNKLSIQGKNTRLDNTSSKYNEIHFYNDGTKGLNNVTVANNSAFGHRVNGVISDNITLETNGDFTLENATMNVTADNLKFDRNADGSLADKGLGNTDDISFKIAHTKAGVNNLSITSTEGNVNAIAKTNVNAKGNINLTSNKASLNIKDDTSLVAGKDVNLKAYNSITFGAKGDKNVNIDNSSKIAAAANINVTSTNSDINAEKTTMPTLTYGERLKFDAKGSNNFTSENSLKSVNVDYVAGESNNFTTKGDIQFTNSSFNSKNNNITTTEEGGDVILNNLTIKVATADAKDTVTKINAKGNVTNKDVTGTYEADSKASVHTFPNSVDVKFNVEDAKNAGGPALDVNNTKLIVKTSVKKDASNPDNGSIILNVKNANNKDAGLELTAENSEGWDGISTIHEGPEVHINAEDDELAISRIVTDKLFTDANDKMYAAPVALTPEELAGLPEGTPSKGYIEVRDYMGFNQDSDFTTDPSDFDYTGDYVPGKGPNDIDVNKKHTINFGDTNEDFILVYDRPVGECPEPPAVVPDDDPIVLPTNADSLINQIKLPREQVEISKTSKVSDNTVDQTSNIMSAAAKVDLGQEENADDEDEAAEE